MSVRIASPAGETRAEFAPDAGMVCASLIHQDREVLEQRRGLEAYRERGKTLGIPLLYPWANRLAADAYAAAGHEVELPRDGEWISRDEHGLPIHGVIPRLMRWQASAAAAELEARLRWDAPELLELFPFRHEALLRTAVEPGRLTVEVEVRADGDEAVPVSFGFHPYLRLPGPRAECEVQLPAARRLHLDQQSIPTGDSEPLEPRRFTLGDSAWDDGLELAGPRGRYVVSGPEGTVALQLLEGYGFGQVFAPPGSEFICFEPMTAPANALRSGRDLAVLSAGQSYRAAFAIELG